MARGDVVAATASVANSSSLTYQPASGSEVVITAVATGRRVGTAQYVEVRLQGASYTATVFDFGTTALGWPESQMRLFINNTCYLQLYNNTGSSLNMGYSGIQTK
jgi:hypothetical protein